MDAEKIGKVASVAKSAEHKTAQILKESQEAHQQKCGQLDQLVTFKQEYEANLGAQGRASIAARQLQDYRLFLSKLDQAIQQQTQAVQLSLESLDAVREEWLSKNRHRTSLDTLLDRTHREWLQKMEKIEQKEADESTLTRSLTKNEV